MTKESRRARRLRKRRNSTTPRKLGVPTIPHPYILFCQGEDHEHEAYLTIAGADSPEEGDRLTREMQQVGWLTLRCDLVENTDEAITAWAGQ